MQQPEMQIVRSFFETQADIYQDLAQTGHWPTTYHSGVSPELPLHWHNVDVSGYVLEGNTYVLDAQGKRQDLTPGDKLIIPAGALHAEGAVTEPVTYLVGIAVLKPFTDVFMLLDPASYPEAKLLDLDPDLIAALTGQ